MAARERVNVVNLQVINPEHVVAELMVRMAVLQPRRFGYQHIPLVF